MHPRSPASRVAAVVIALTAMLSLAPASARAATAEPTVKGPIGDAGLWGHALWDSWFSLEELGYVEDEYFVSGTATGHSSPTDTAEFMTRIIVNRPARARDFNGTVLLEWVNVTAQFENAVDIISAHEMLIRDGYAFVHVSAQAAGICCTPLTPKVWDPVRYEELSHPGDDYAFGIFTQIARAIRSPKGADPMDGLKVRRVLAAGQSQSAIRLRTYVVEVQPSARAIDGFLIHGDTGNPKAYPRPPGVPVLHLLSDFEAAPDDPNTTTNYRLWEVAGSAHSDFWIGYQQIFGQGPRSLFHRPKQSSSGADDIRAVAGNYGEQIHPMLATCIFAGTAFPMRYAVSAAIHHLDKWTKTGKAPAGGPRFEFDGNMLARDEFGNALGGIRLPPVEVPVASYVSTVCGLGGKTIPFTEIQLLQLYPTHADYYAEMRNSTRASVKTGFLLKEDAEDLLARACAAKVRWQDFSGSDCDGR